jgi:hypothetical protein
MRGASLIGVAAAFLARYAIERPFIREQRTIVPPTFELVDCEFAHGLFGLVSPPAYYCVYLVHGTKDAAATELAEALEARGYAVERSPYFDAIELRGRKPELRVTARIGARSVGPHLVPNPIPQGYIAASVTVGKPES